MGEDLPARLSWRETLPLRGRPGAVRRNGKPRVAGAGEAAGVRFDFDHQHSGGAEHQQIHVALTVPGATKFATAV